MYVLIIIIGFTVYKCEIDILSVFFLSASVYFAAKYKAADNE